MEALLAMGLGLAMIGAAVQLFSKSLDATYLVSQRAEMQQDVRAAENILVKDIGLAGAGLPPGGVALAKAAPRTPSMVAIRLLAIWAVRRPRVWLFPAPARLICTG